MKKTIKLEFDSCPEWLDLDFLESCLFSESHMKDVKVVLIDDSKQLSQKHNHQNNAGKKAESTLAFPAGQPNR